MTMSGSTCENHVIVGFFTCNLLSSAEKKPSKKYY